MDQNSFRKEPDMKLPAPTEGGSFERPPAGMFPAICYRIIDIGTQPEEYNGETKLKRKVIVYWEIHDPEATTSDGRPMSISKKYTYSMHEKATLRADLESWRGKKFNDVECVQFDIENLLGQACYLSIIETKSKKTGNPYSKVSNVNKPPKHFEMPEQVNLSTFLGLTPTDFDKVVFDGLGERLKAMIESSREYKAIMNGTARDTENPAEGFDDEIPF
jgi:hypothetical protein